MSVEDCSHASSGKTLAQFLAFASMSRKKENWAKTHIHEISNFISLFQFHIQGKIYEKLCLKGWVFAGRKITKVNWNWIYKVNSNIVFSSVVSEFEIQIKKNLKVYQILIFGSNFAGVNHALSFEESSPRRFLCSPHCWRIACQLEWYIQFCTTLTT